MVCTTWFKRIAERPFCSKMDYELFDGKSVKIVILDQSEIYLVAHGILGRTYSRNLVLLSAIFFRGIYINVTIRSLGGCKYLFGCCSYLTILPVGAKLYVFDLSGIVASGITACSLRVSTVRFIVAPRFCFIETHCT